MSTPLNIYPVLVHDYGSKLVPHACIYELAPPGVSWKTSRWMSNALVFIGGLGDGPHSVPAIRAVADRLERMGGGLEDWSVFEIRLNSSFEQWGFSSLREDVREIGEVVSYLRDRLGRRRVVLMGHSTGCQVCYALSVCGSEKGTGRY